LKTKTIIKENAYVIWSQMKWLANVSCDVAYIYIYIKLKKMGKKIDIRIDKVIIKLNMHTKTYIYILKKWGDFIIHIIWFK
jgi:hypothetical protein